MKAKKLFTLILAVLMIALTVVSVSAAQLTETNNSGQTEVKAHISGKTPDPGDVTYIITIPDVVDFGELEQPANTAEDHFKDVAYKVTATKIEGLDADTQQVSVYVRDQGADANGNQEFWIANKTDSTKKFSYNVYTTTEITNGTVEINRDTMTGTIGYFFNGFTVTGEEINGTLRLNQNQLCDYDISQIVGDYSGYMVFYSAIEDQ